MYHIEVWGGCRVLEAVEQADASGTGILGVGGLHCKVFLQFEMQMFPLRFEIQRCSEF